MAAASKPAAFVILFSASLSKALAPAAALN